MEIRGSQAGVVNEHNVESCLGADQDDEGDHEKRTRRVRGGETAREETLPQRRNGQKRKRCG